MGTIAKENFARGCEQLFKYDANTVKKIDQDEDCLTPLRTPSDHFPHWPE